MQFAARCLCVACPHLLSAPFLPRSCCCHQQLPVLCLHLRCLQPALQGVCCACSIQLVCNTLQHGFCCCTGCLLLLYCFSPCLHSPVKHLALVEAEGLGKCLPLGCCSGSFVLPALQHMPINDAMPMLVSSAEGEAVAVCGVKLASQGWS